MKIRYSIETSWAHGGYSDEIDLDDGYLSGMTQEEIDGVIEEAVDEAVANNVSWEWEVL